MFGHGRESQINRLRRVIESVYKVATPPEYRERLLSKRNEKLIRTVFSPASSELGAGAGMLTIAALSRERLTLLKSKLDSNSFALSSVV
jgi:hypothetical protein